MLPSKTIPEVNWKGQGHTLKSKGKASTCPPKKRVKTQSVEAEEVQDNSAPNLQVLNWNTVSWQAQFPKLYQLACDILCIPGE